MYFADAVPVEREHRFFSDSLGVPIAAANADATRAFEDAFWGFVTSQRGWGAHLKVALELDATMPMAIALRGFLDCLVGAQGRLRSSELAAVHQLSREARRERAHLTALSYWREAELKRACVVLEAHLHEQPRDLLALKIAYALYFQIGDCISLRERPERALAAWSDKLPGFGHLHAMYSFGLAEAGDPAAAASHGRLAMQLDPADPWAVHAVVHALAMQSRTYDAIDLLENVIARWDGAAFLRGHLLWHISLSHWEAGDFERALDCHDRWRCERDAGAAFNICEDISMLARLELVGEDVADRWAATCAIVAHAQGVPMDALQGAHYALATGSMPVLETRGTAGRVNVELGRQLCEAIAAWRQGNEDRTRRLLARIHARLGRLGGSRAERELIMLVLRDVTRTAVPA